MYCKSCCISLDKNQGSAKKKLLCLVKREKRSYVLKSGKLNSLLPTSCPSWTALGIINYPLKYTVEVLSAGMRPREKGKLCDLTTYKLLTPGLSPGRLPESSQKAWVKHHIWTLSLWPLHALSLQVLAIPLHFNTPKGGREGEGWELLRMDSLGD